MMKDYIEMEMIHRAEINEMEESRRRRLERKAARTRKNKISRIKNTAFALAVIIGTTGIAYHLARNWECYDSVARKQLQNDINNGDKEAITFYRDNYINRDIYLFDGYHTIAMLAARHGLDVEATQEAFDNSGYTHIQDWFDNELKDQLS